MSRVCVFFLSNDYFFIVIFYLCINLNVSRAGSSFMIWRGAVRLSGKEMSKYDSNKQHNAMQWVVVICNIEYLERLVKMKIQIKMVQQIF